MQFVVHVDDDETGDTGCVRNVKYICIVFTQVA